VEPGVAPRLLDELLQAAGGREFGSMDELQAFTDSYMSERNRAPIDDFHGISAEQMQRLLYSPFASPRLVDFAEVLGAAPSAAAASLLGLLTKAVAEGELKPTGKGNLPRQVCRDIAQSYRDEWPGPGRRLESSVNGEQDFEELHVVRLVAEQAGLVRKYKGKFILGRECRQLLEKDGLGSIYPRLFITYLRTFNWSYRDHYPELGFIQQSALFSLYLLQLQGGATRSQRFYEDAFLRAFPLVLNEVDDSAWRSGEDQLRSCYTLRTLERFAWFFGLVTLEPIETDVPFGREYRVSKLSLLDELISFHLHLP
jgi:hypothetical protein